MTRLPLPRLPVRNFLVLATLFLGATAASGQVFVGSDDFNSGFQATNWEAPYRLYSASHGELSFTNNRLDFSKEVGHGNRFYLWDSDGTADPFVAPSSFSSNWIMSLTATNTLGGLGSGEYAAVGLNLFNDASEFWSVMLNRNENGTDIRVEGTNFATDITSIATNTNVVLQLSWDATAQILDAAYSLNGTEFSSVATFNPVTGWTNSAPETSVDNGFNFGVFGNADTSNAIVAGSIYVDNFSVSAVPEPSTYAAIVGAAFLGFAVWHRRRSRTVATVAEPGL